MRKNDHREGAGGLVFAEIKEVHTAFADFHSDYLPGHASRFVDMLSGFLKWNAIRSKEEGHSEDHEQRDQRSIPAP